MILVEVCETVVEVDWRTNVIWNVELKSADWRARDADTPWRSCGVLRPLPLRSRCAIRMLEGRVHLGLGDLGKLVGCGGIAVGVVDSQFLDLQIVLASPSF